MENIKERFQEFTTLIQTLDKKLFQFENEQKEFVGFIEEQLNLLESIAEGLEKTKEVNKEKLYSEIWSIIKSIDKRLPKEMF